MKRTESTATPDKNDDDIVWSAPRPSTVIAEPATVEACAADYAAASQTRADFNKQAR